MALLLAGAGARPIHACWVGCHRRPCVIKQRHARQHTTVTANGLLYGLKG